jgi:hydrogenase nickel incorporation protein HypA/HybF
MHEYSLALSLIETVEGEGLKRNASKIERIVLKVGKFSGVEPILLSHSFEILKKEKEWFKNTVLEIDIENPEMKCRNCDGIFKSDDFPFICPECGNPFTDMVKGSDIVIEKIEMEI